MLRKLSTLVLILATASLLVDCSSTNHGADLNNEQKGNRSNKKKTELIVEDMDPILEQIKSMTLNEKIGQLIMAGFNGYDINDSTIDLIDNYHIGGFILFKRNIKSAEQLLYLVNSLKAANEGNREHLFISVDEEGGRVTRMPGELIKLPSSKVIGGINDESFSYEIGKAIGQELKAFGINMNFAPVLDINSNPNNPVIGDRAFGDDSDTVLRLGVETMKGLVSEGVISVVKHFPGHGDTSVDSHVGLPVVNNDMNRLMELELVPFRGAIENGVDVIMTSHILLPQIDSSNPASLSSTVITGMLREKMAFEGVVITDDLTMGAITENYSLNDAATKAIQAGSDIVLIAHGHDNVVGVINAIKASVENKSISEESINKSVYRILKLKRKYDIKDVQINSVDVDEINTKITKILNKHIK